MRCEVIMKLNECEKKNQKLRGQILLPVSLVLLQSLLYGFGDPITKEAFEVMPVFSMLTIRYSIAFAALMLFKYSSSRASSSICFGRIISRGRMDSSG